MLELRELDYAVQHVEPTVEGYLATADGQAELNAVVRPHDASF